MRATLDFRVLGSIEVFVNGKPVPIAGPRQRTVLAMLLLMPNQVISVDRLAEAVWNNSPPATSRTQIAICIASLRKSFQLAGYDQNILVTAPPGYRLLADGHRIDAADFTTWLQDAGTLAEQGKTAEAVDRLANAMGLWRGRALAGISSDVVSSETVWLEEQRLAACEQHAALSLELGRHHWIVPELASLVQQQPLREHARATLMLALYRSGRRSEALAQFRQARQVFVEELGLEPGRALQNLHDAILRDDPALTPVAAFADPLRAIQPAAPFPADVPEFAGRGQELRRLNGMLDRARRGRAGTAALILGQPGVGKTALAVRWAHSVRPHFPDGQLFADVRLAAQAGGDLTSAVLARLLGAVGLADREIPPGRRGRAALFRRLVSGQRALILLDDVPAAARLEIPLPKDGACCLLMTSRAQQSLPSALAPICLTVEPLPLTEAVTMLKALADGRPDGARRAAEQVAQHCEGLPLALAAAAARLEAKRHWSLGDLASRLRDPLSRLDELSSAKPGLRPVYDQAYRDLDPAAAAAYRRLGLLKRPELSAKDGAALLGTTVMDAEDLLEQLTDAGMLGVAGRGPNGRFCYRMPALLALHAQERTALEDGEADREAAEWRLAQVRQLQPAQSGPALPCLDDGNTSPISPR